jgi:beta-galactosidase
MRRLGLSIDFLSSETRNFAGYDLIMAAGMMHVPDNLKDALAQCSAQVLLGPRSAARDEHMAIPVPLPPDLKEFDVTVVRVQTIRPDISIPLAGGGTVNGYLEHIEGCAEDILKTPEGESVAKTSHNMTYLAGWLDDAGFERLLTILCEKAKIDIIHMPYGVRRRQAGDEEFWFNYTACAVDTVVGNIAPADVLKI